MCSYAPVFQTECRVFIFSSISANSPLRRFTSVKDSHLPNNNDKQLDGKNQEQCAHVCEHETAFPCRSFDYDKQKGRCYLSKAVVSKVPAVSSSSYDYYEMSK